jgi:hypothetical protein
VEGSCRFSLCDTTDVFSQHSAESAIQCLDVRDECNTGGSFVGLGSLCYRFQGSSHLPEAVSIFLDNGGEKFQFLGEGILSQRALCIWEARTDCLFTGW